MPHDAKRAITYSIKRSARRRTLTITVERDRSVVVHAPTGVSDEKIRAIVEAKRRWLQGKLKHVSHQDQGLSAPPGKELADGESASYLGRSYRIESSPAGSKKAHLFYRFLIPRGSSSKRREELKNWYCDRCREKIFPRIKLFAERLGVEFAKVEVMDSRCRWGSCTTRNTIKINWRLIKAPMFVIDYVILHELAHLLETNHSERFWNILQAQTPTIAKAKTWLVQNGQRLLEET